MLGIESPVRELSDNQKKEYQQIIINLVKEGIDFGEDLDAIYKNGWYDGYEDCLNEGCEIEDIDFGD